MVVISPQEIQELQEKTKNIRNICVLAHVDHDYLICSNGIISSNLAGTIRYMDSREDEQEKGITMKSSCISLQFTSKQKEDFIINLIDSPGHVDFSSEVSTAARLTDGALVLVDAVEGVCIQTRTVLLQAFKEKIKPCLVINKIDRLILEKQLTPLETYKRLMRILENINALLSTFTASELFLQSALSDDSLIENDNIDSDTFFSPQKGNVAFASAMDGWAFRIGDFARLFSKKLGMKEEVLQKVLWGDYFLCKKEVKKKPNKHDQDPMFVQFILKNIYDIYCSIHLHRDQEKAEKILTTFKMSTNILKKADTRQQLKIVMSSFLPLPVSILSMVVEQLPEPITAQRERITKLIPDLSSSKDKVSETPVSQDKNERQQIRNFRKKVKRNLFQCDKSDTAEVLIFVSKMLEIDTLPSATISGHKLIPELHDTQEIEQTKEEHSEESQHFIGFSRIFSGTIKVGQKLHILGPRYNPQNPSKHRTEFTVTNLYLLFGRSLEPVSHVPAGNIFGIGGVSAHILKSATISSSPYSPIFSAMYLQASPIVRIAIEPQSLSDMGKLVKGLKLLNQSDPSVEVLVQETGEHVILTAGEVHAERCLRDLTEKFAKVAIQVSAPIVNFKETIVPLDNGTIPPVCELSLSNKQCTFCIRAIPLPQNISSFIEEHKEILKNLTSKSIDAEFTSYEIFEELKIQFKKAGKNWEKEWDNVWGLGPKRYGPNILLNHIAKYKAPYFRSIEKRITDKEVVFHGDVATEELIKNLQMYDNSILAGFQLATSSGPLCDEPMMGVCFVVEDISFDTSNLGNASESQGPLGGQLIGAMKDVCRKAFDVSPRRLVEAMYKCEVQATQSSLGQVYAVLRKRRAKILDESIGEGTELFIIKCLLPVVESFGFIDELRTKSSGNASPQLAFSHWQILDVDPFYVPTTEEEIEEFGESDTNAPNIAKDYINRVRERKGLIVKKKLVEFGNKQRTLSKKK